MNILITGSNGFIGKHLKEYFHGLHEIYTVARKGTETKHSGNNYEIDLSDVSYIKKIVKGEFFVTNIDVIIHCAAIISGSDNTNIDIFHKNNAITESIIQVARLTNAKQLINISSIGVYPNTSGTYTEDSAIEPSMNHECLYGLSKVCSEELFKFYLKKDLKVVNIRLGQVYGDRMREDRIYSLMKNELITSNKITVFGNGKRVSNFIRIEYFINKIEQILKNGNIEGTFNLGEENLSYLELAKMIINMFGSENSQLVLKEDGVQSEVIIDSSKINRLLNS